MNASQLSLDNYRETPLSYEGISVIAKSPMPGSRFRTGYATPDSTEVYTAKVVPSCLIFEAWLQWNGVEGSTFHQIL